MKHKQFAAVLILTAMIGVLFGAYLSFVVMSDAKALTTQAVIWIAIMLLFVGVVIVVLNPDAD
jgi:hypothetical protein